MGDLFITNIKIEHVRHLRDVEIPLSNDGMKHLILTGKNGSGKTSVLDALSNYLNIAATSDTLAQSQKLLDYYNGIYNNLEEEGEENAKVIETEEKVNRYKNKVENAKSGIEVKFNQSTDSLRYHFEKGKFVLAYYKADRTFETITPKHVEKVDLQDKYLINDEPFKEFIKYLLDLKVTEALCRTNDNIVKADTIKGWFDKLEVLLQDIFDDKSLKLVFDEDNFQFFIHENNREPFDFNTLSSGYAAILNIVVDLIMRMEKSTNKSFDFSMPGIVLIDEIETHLHLEMQKNALKLLTNIFPNIQFIVSTHSPFILNSIENAVIFDLEKKTLVKDGLSNVPYDGIVEGYFSADLLSDKLKKKFDRYKELVSQERISQEDFEELSDLEIYLDEIPDYLALDITTEYKRLKIEFEQRDDI